MKQNILKFACLSLVLALAVPTVSAQGYRRGDYKRGRTTSTILSSPRSHGGGFGWDSYNHYTGIRLGLNVASLAFDGTSGVSKSPLAGLNLGFVTGHRISPWAPIFIEPGLFYTQKGVKGSRGTEDLKVNMHYFEVPVVFKYKIDLDYGLNQMSVQPFLGGFASLGFAGKTKDFDAREKISTFSDEAFSCLDAGLRLGCGFELEHFYAELSYDWGLANVARHNFRHLGYDNFDDKIHTSTLSATIGLNF